MISLVFRTTQFIAYHLLISTVDRISRLPRNSNPPEVMRLLRENIALKAQVSALVLELKAEKGSRPRVSMRTRTAQVFAYLLTRGDSAFQNYYLSASQKTVAKWTTRSLGWHPARGAPGDFLGGSDPSPPSPAIMGIRGRPASPPFTGDCPRFASGLHSCPPDRSPPNTLK